MDNKLISRFCIVGALAVGLTVQAQAQRPPSEYFKERDGSGNLVGYVAAPIKLSHSAVELEQNGTATVRLFGSDTRPYVFRGTWRGNADGSQARLQLTRGLFKEEELRGQGTVWFGPRGGLRSIALSGTVGRRQFSANFEASSASAPTTTGPELDLEVSGQGRAGTASERVSLTRGRVKLEADGKASFHFTTGGQGAGSVRAAGRWIRRGKDYLITLRGTPGDGFGIVYMRSGTREVDHIDLEAVSPMGGTWKFSFISN